MKDVLTGTDGVAIKTASELLSTELSKIGEAMSKQAQAEQAKKPEDKKDDSKGEDNIKDAEFTEKK